MISKESINQTLISQKENLLLKEKGLKREVLPDLPDFSAYALIISGIRRCGKSTLLFQMLKERYPDALYLNFEDPRLYEFERKDFLKLDEIIREAGSKVLLFDEIQIILEWERYVRQKLD
jgi:predicted AAA+ superfamily ATPase